MALPSSWISSARGARTVLMALASAVLASTAHAQARTPTSGIEVEAGFMAIGALTRVSPAYANRAITELQLVQPALVTSAAWRSLRLLSVLNGEGYTLRRGELTPGIWGEGYVDRRHPHTLVHEAMLTWASPQLSRAMRGVPASLQFSFAAGKGFVPFGSDDPMMRPFDKYPVNHHHAQILERVQIVGAARVARGSLALSFEGATFNGDEPAGPFHGPRWNRVGDSWSLRATLQLLPGVEISGSRASLYSPELQQGGAFDHGQQHVALRINRSASNGDVRYLLAEWARTDEITGNQVAFRYPSALVETAWGWHGFTAAARWERTARGEQQRLLDPFRTPLGHVDFQNLGVTNWQVATAALTGPALPLPSIARHMVSPYVEVARATPTPRNRPTVFEPAAFYGSATLWSLSAGLRVHIGTMRSRMGRYGVMRDSPAGHEANAQHHRTQHGSSQ
ncbi:MAG: hypothetical protein ACO1Q7_09970 [Gemmatimonas sp.]